MRRRSERKKSLDISSPVPNLKKASRRLKKSPLQTFDEDVDQHQGTESLQNVAQENSDSRQSSSPGGGEKALIQNKTILIKEDQTEKLLHPTGSENTILDLIIHEEDANHQPKLEQIFLESESAENKGTLNLVEKMIEPVNMGDNLEKKAPVQMDDNSNANDNIVNNNFHSKGDHYDIDLKNENESMSDSVCFKKEKMSYVNQKLSDVSRVRKRKWISKKQSESLFPILSISTDSLKNLVSDVKPVPLSDIKLDSSPDVEEVGTDKEYSPDRSPLIVKYGILEQKKMEKAVSKSNSIESVGAGVVPYISFRSPSPSKNVATNVLYITNLVRPFTVLQLKGLLARTGKIVSEGFWIDRIKSKCYVQYETEDEAIETRHALHGIRWPTSNPKCLNVDFGRKEDMKRAILSTKDDSLNLCQDNAKENSGISSSFPKDDKKIRPVREWDVGKNNNSDAEKIRDREKARSSDRQKDRNLKDCDGEKNEKKHSHIKKTRNSVSPVRKQKKKDSDPPLRLLDDLFRKTQTTPSIYWLPLTPEQISEKETIRKKRLDEQQLRIQQREMEREKAYEREKERNREKHRDREKDQKLDRSIDRRKSRSRERRRY